MKRSILTTSDGSPTIQLDNTNITYHSKHGAIQESVHVFINAGLEYYMQLHHPKNINILEVGFGTGLNTALTYNYSLKNSLYINYTTIEPYPLEQEIVQRLHYNNVIADATLYKLHTCKWNENNAISNHFNLYKAETTLQNIKLEEPIDVIFFDAFAPDDQPELWTTAIFKKLFNMLTNNGILVTYCSKGSVRRTLQGVGFTVEKLLGPPGKREMIRATKK